MNIIDILSKRLNIRSNQVESTIKLLSSGATIPFISRYRKEATGGLNEVQVTQIKELNEQLEELAHRKDF